MCRTTEEVGLADEAAMGPYRRLCGGVGGCAHPAHPPAIGDSIYLPGCRASARLRSLLLCVCSDHPAFEAFDVLVTDPDHPIAEGKLALPRPPTASPARDGLADSLPLFVFVAASRTHAVDTDQARLAAVGGRRERFPRARRAALRLLRRAQGRPAIPDQPRIRRPRVLRGLQLRARQGPRVLPRPRCVWRYPTFM